ncbi:MAG: type VI secretion system ATPase TssH, partial [Rikenellaceae bacterium]|nr:type VI secretion system ATPase TssH [Rikenellaceae bacterium]
MNINSLTIKAQEALQQAFALAQRGGQQALDPLHILSTLIAEEDSLGAFLLGRVGVNVKLLRENVQRAVASLPQVSGAAGEQYFSHEASAVVQRAVDFTATFG